MEAKGWIQCMVQFGFKTDVDYTPQLQAILGAHFHRGGPLLQCSMEDYQ